MGWRSIVGAIVGWALASLAITVQAAEPSVAVSDKTAFNLVCLGAGNSAASKAGASAPSAGPADQRGSVDLWLDARSGRIHIPFDLFAKGQVSGEWYELGSIGIAEHQITAIIESRLVGRPKLWISRIDGTMTISLKDRQYIGMCSEFDPARMRRSF